MLLCIVLPQQYGISTIDNDPIKATYLLCLGLVVLSLGSLTLTARWRIQGLGGVIGAASVSTVVAFDMVNTTLDRIGSSDLGSGFWAGFVAPLVLLSAGVLAVAAARRETDAGFAALHVSDWTSWVVLVLAVAGALILVPTAMETYSSLSRLGPAGTLAGGPRRSGATNGRAHPASSAGPVAAPGVGACLRNPRPSDLDVVGGLRRLLAWHVVRHAHPRCHRRPSPDSPPQPHLEAAHTFATLCFAGVSTAESCESGECRPVSRIGDLQPAADAAASGVRQPGRAFHVRQGDRTQGRQDAGLV